MSRVRSVLAAMARVRRGRRRSPRSRIAGGGCSRRRSWASSRGADRDAWQKPDSDHGTRCASATARVVADVGAGGWFTVRLARRVGPNGKVYAGRHPAGDARGDPAPRPARRLQQRAVCARQDGGSVGSPACRNTPWTPC